MAKDGMATATKINAGAQDNPTPETTPETTPDPATAPAPTEAPAETAAPAETPETVQARGITAERARTIASYIELERLAKKIRPQIFFLLGKEDASLTVDERQFMMEASLTCDFVQNRSKQIVEVLAGRIQVKDIHDIED